MDNYTAIGIAEGFIECEDKEEIIKAWQHLIDTGQCWQLQGWFGRTAAYLIETGQCKLPPAPKETILENTNPGSKNGKHHKF